jgi:hypothetical protein
MGSLARSIRREQERKKNRIAAAEYRGSERWNELLEFCRHHSSHGEMEFQSDGDDQHMVCLLCSKSFECAELPEVLFRELVRRFQFGVWLDV